MEQNENVYSMYTTFTDIVNLGVLGKTSQIARKLKKSLGHFQKNGDLKEPLLKRPKI